MNIDGRNVVLKKGANTVSELSLIEPSTVLTLAHIANLDHGSGKYILEQTSDLPSVDSPAEIELNYNTILNPPHRNIRVPATGMVSCSPSKA